MSYELNLENALSIGDVNEDNYEEKKAACESIDIKTLCLKIDLNPDDTEEFSKANRLTYLPKLIPSTVRLLRIHPNCRIGTLSQDEVTAFISALPTTIKALSLSSNIFTSDTNENRLLTILNACPSKLKVINLSYLNLSSLSPANIENVFEALPQTLEKLILSGNNLNRIEERLFKKLFKTLPPTLRDLDLHLNHLTDKQIKNLLPFFARSNITNINLCNSNLSYETSKKLRNILESNRHKPTASPLNANSIFHPQATIQQNRSENHSCCTLQ